ncbi:tail fiber domain-containing protein [Cronobacter dublinensis]
MLKRASASQALYIRGRGEDNSLRWYMGNGSADDVLTLHNYLLNTTLQLNGSEVYTNRNFKAGGTLTLIGNGESNAIVGSGTSDVFLNNTKSAKYLQLKDNGVLAYSDNAVYHQGFKPTPADIGALSSSGGQVSGPVVATNPDGFRIKYGSFGSFMRNDGANTYFLLTNSGDQEGSWNGLRPIYWSNTSGNVTMQHSVSIGGALAVNNKITVLTQSNSWINMRTGTAVEGNAAVSNAAAAPIVRQEHADRHYILGGLGNSQFGIYMINKSRTVNGTDAYAYLGSDGTWNCSGNGSFNDVYIRSDRRSKRNIKKINGALDKLERIDGVLYELQDINGYTQSAGLVAQQVQEVQPELVTSDIDHASQEERLRLNYNGVIGMLVEAVKELRCEVKELKEAMQ